MDRRSLIGRALRHLSRGTLLLQWRIGLRLCTELQLLVPVMMR